MLSGQCLACGTAVNTPENLPNNAFLAATADEPNSNPIYVAGTQCWDPENEQFLLPAFTVC
jgi:hypothetical protein